MKSAAVTKLKASLSKYLNWVKAGEEVLVIERGQPVAKIVPVEKGGPESLQEMEKQGLIKRGSGRLPKKLWQLVTPKDAEGIGLKFLLEEREEGR